MGLKLRDKVAIVGGAGQGIGFAIASALAADGPKVSKPQYRLRAGDIRVSYDVAEQTVEVLAIVSKDEASSWLAKFGTPE